MHKQSKRIVIGIVIIIFLYSVSYTVTVVRANARLRQAYAALERNGRPMQPADVIPPEMARIPNESPDYWDDFELSL